jgi:glucose/arabinose dehydrogenase
MRYSTGAVALSPPRLAIVAPAVHAGKHLCPRSWRLAAGLAAVVALAAALTAGAAGAASGTFQGVRLGTFDKPMDVTQAPGEPNLVFVVEEKGKVMLLRNGQPLAHPFLDITNLVLAPPTGAGDQGLLSIAFPPDYQQSHRFYVYFTDHQGASVVDEFQTSAQNPVVARRSTRRQVIRIPHAASDQHYGGQLQFGPDGLLYFATGDGGSTPAAARKLDNLLGKVIRIDPRAHGSEPYRIPTANPYVGDPDRRPEIFAYGLRNPWRFSFDGRSIAIGDVGAGNWEEVDMLPIGTARGANFGWPQYEGDVPWPGNPGGPVAPDPPTFPMFTYAHTGGRCAIIGGYVVHDPNLPDLAGRYIYGDLCTGEVRSFVPHVGSQQATDDAPVGSVSAPEMTTFGEGIDGQIYYAELPSGDVFQLEETSP